MSQQQQRVVSLLQQACSLLGDANNTTGTASNSSSSNSSVQLLRVLGLLPGSFSHRTGLMDLQGDGCSIRHQDGTLSREEKRVLQEAGLGEIKIIVPKTNSFIDLRQKLSEFFPKLKEAGGFQLLRSAVGSRNLLEVIRMPPEGYTTQYLSDRCGLGQAMIYVRPLQTCRSVSPVKSQSGTEVFHEKCLNCGNDVPLMDMQKHIEVCGNSDSIDCVKKTYSANGILFIFGNNHCFGNSIFIRNEVTKSHGKGLKLILKNKRTIRKNM